MTLGKRKDTLNGKGKHQIKPCGEIACSMLWTCRNTDNKINAL